MLETEAEQAPLPQSKVPPKSTQHQYSGTLCESGLLAKARRQSLPKQSRRLSGPPRTRRPELDHAIVAVELATGGGDRWYADGVVRAHGET